MKQTAEKIEQDAQKSPISWPEIEWDLIRQKAMLLVVVDLLDRHVSTSSSIDVDHVAGLTYIIEDVIEGPDRVLDPHRPIQDDEP